MATLRRAVLACITLCLSFIPTTSAAQDFWTRAGLSEEDVKQLLWPALTSGQLMVRALPALRALPSGSRNAMIASAVSYAKKYSQSAEFRKQYADNRAVLKPEAPVVLTTAQRKAADRDSIRKSLVQLDSVLALARTVSADAAAGIRAAIEQQKELLKSIDDPNNPNYSKDFEAAMAEVYASDRARYSEDLKKWQTDYPADPSAVIRRSIREFLALSATVDFTAKVEKVGESRVFVNPEYESKSYTWKALYRAGKETTTTLRAAAQQWLTELK